MTSKQPAQRCDALAFWRAREGVAAIEFALVAMFLVTLFAGTCSFGIAIYMKAQVQNAARAGAAYASSRPPYNEAAIKKAAEDATALGTKVVAVPSQSAPSCINATTGVITSAGTATTCPDGVSKPAVYVTVLTSLEHTLVLPLPEITVADGKMTLRGKAVARMP